MADKLMYILNEELHKITPSVDYNSWLKCLDTQLNESTNQNSLKVPKVVSPMNEKNVITKLWGLV